MLRSSSLFRVLPRSGSCLTPGARNASLRRFLATTTSLPQTLIEKIVQDYAVDLPEGKKVRSGDYVMIKPEHV